MPSKSQTYTDGGGGEAFLTAAGQRPAVLGEVVDKGLEVYQGKQKKKCQAIWLMVEDLVGNDGPDDTEGQLKLVYWWVNNERFTNLAPQWRTEYEKSLATWAGRSIPPERQHEFIFGRELGKGKDEWGNDKWDASLVGVAMREQRAQMPGVPVGSQALLNVVHNEKDGKTYANPAAAFPPDLETWMGENPGKEQAEYYAMASAWVSGIMPPDKNARRYTLNESRELLCDGKPTGYTYILDADRAAERDARKAEKDTRSSGGSQSKTAGQQQGVFDEEEDGDIPF